MKRREMLEGAIKTVCQDRQSAYGTPESSLGAIASLWTAHLRSVGLLASTGEITPALAAQLMILLKIARSGGNMGHVDSWLDMAGYAACGCEVATETPLLGVPASDPEVKPYQ